MLKIIRKNYLLLFIFLAALFIRLWGTNPGFPPHHPDENMSYSTAIYMFFNHFKPNRFDYPSGVPLLHSLIYQTFFLPFVFLKMFFPHPRVLLTAISLGNQFLAEFQTEIFGQAGIKAMFWSRYISATIGALCIPLVYLVGKRSFNQRVGLFAAFFLAFNYRHVLGSHFGLPDIHNSFFSLLALFASVLLLEKNTRPRYLFAGATVGLAFSMKYQLFSFLPFFFVHLIWTVKKRSVKYFFQLDFLKACLLSLLVFLLINPYFFFNLEAVKKKSLVVYLRYQMGLFRLRLYPYFYLYHWGIGHLPSLAIIFGLLLMFFIKPLKFFIIFSFALPFFLMMTYCSAGGDFTRNFITVMPLLMLYAGFFLEIIYRVFKKIKLPAEILLSFLLLYFNFIPMKNSLTLAQYYHQPWNFTELSKWFEEKMPQKTKIRSYPLHMHYTVWQNKNIEMTDWNYSAGPHSLAEFQEEGTDFAILNTRPFDDITYWWRQWPNEIFFQYDQVPFDFIESSFYGLSVKELMNYTVAEIYKPWQAAGEYNFLVFKIPSKPLAIGQRIVFFGFDKKEDLWEVRSTFGFNPIKAGWEAQIGKSKKGSLVIRNGSGETTSRLSSKAIKITPSKLYTIKGWLKNSPGIEKSEPDSFLRIDFYRGQNQHELEKNGLTLALSSRTAVSNEWSQKQVTLVAPEQANFLTISFQRQDSHQGFDSFLDDVEVFESEVLPKEKFPELPYIQSTIPRASIYPPGTL